MIQVGTKFSSEPRNGYKHIYQIVDKDSNGYTVRNTSFPKVDARGKERWESKTVVETAFENGDFIKLKL